MSKVFWIALFTVLFLVGCPEEATVDKQDAGTDAKPVTDIQVDKDVLFDRIDFEPMEIRAFRDVSDDLDSQADASDGE